MHSLTRWISSSALLLFAACFSVAFAQSADSIASPQSSPTLNYKTPADEVLLPYIQSHTAPPPANTDGQLQPMGSSYLMTPNFGGYVNAPMVDGRTTYSLTLSTFNTGVTVEVGGDFDKDGKQDVAVLQQNGVLNVLINNGQGGLREPVTYLNPNVANSSVNVAYAVDINGDGYPDIVAFDSANDTTITWLNLGNGTFNASITTPLDKTYGTPGFAYVADVNGDGKPDLLLTTFKLLSQTSAAVTLEVMLGGGDGTWGTASAAKVQQFQVASSGTLPSVYGITTADINGDGKQDIALVVDQRTSQTAGNFLVTTALGNGDGTFGALGVTNPISVPIISSGIIPVVVYTQSILSLADVNGDGRPDLIADVNGTIYSALGVGDGTFQTAVSSSIMGSPVTTVLLDVNGDGKPDLVTAGGVMGVAIGKGDGTFALPVAGSQYITDPTGHTSLVAGDFNNDGIQDIAQLGSDYKQISLFFGNGTGGFRGAPLITANSNINGIRSTLLTSGKYTANGYSSPILSLADTTTQLITNVSDGVGNFKSVLALPTYPTNMKYIEPIHADFNGDGLEDLVYATTTGDLMVTLSNGDGTFKTPVSAGFPAKPCSLYYGTAGDVNGDGIADIVIPYGGDSICNSTAGGASGYYVALGNGDGTFAKPTFVTYGTALYSVALADINGDGKLDLVLNNAPLVTGTGFAVYTAIGNGNGTFGAPALVLQNYLVSNFATADLNNDGKIDLVLSAEEVQSNTVTTGGIITILGNGDGTFNPPSQIAVGNWFYGMQLADMNNDGNVDIVATLYSTYGQPKTYYGMVTLLGYGNGQFAPPYNSLESLASTVPQVGNFVNDSALDVMTQTGYGPALFIGQGSSSITLSTSAPSITFGQAEMLTATVAATLTNRPAATGTVLFYDGTTLLGTGTLSGGKATYTATSLAPGSHPIKAMYTGDSNFNPATATTTVTVAALAPAFTLNGTPTTVSIKGGAQGVITLNLTANAMFSGAVTLTCAGTPANGTCSVNPGSVTLAANGSSTATLVIGTTSTHAGLKSVPAPWEAPAAGASLAAIFGIFFGRRKRIRMMPLLGLGLLLSLSGLLVGCGNGGNDKTKSALTVVPGTYTVTVTATPASGGLGSVQTAAVTVTVN